VQAVSFDGRKVSSVVKPEVLLLQTAECAVNLELPRSEIPPGTVAGEVLRFVWWKNEKTPAAGTPGAVEVGVRVFVDLVHEGLPV
jgi:hypothetical protein